MSLTATPKATPEAPRPRRAAAGPAARPAGRREAIREAALLTKQVGDPTRLEALLLLAEGPRNVGEICRELGVSQPACSHHLALLRHSRLIEPTRSGKNNIYSSTPAGRRLADAVRGLVEGEG